MVAKPQLLRQGASLIGLADPNNRAAAGEAGDNDEDHLQRFLDQYPYDPYAGTARRTEAPRFQPSEPEAVGQVRPSEALPPPKNASSDAPRVIQASATLPASASPSPPSPRPAPATAAPLVADPYSPMAPRESGPPAFASSAAMAARQETTPYSQTPPAPSGALPMTVAVSSDSPFGTQFFGEEPTATPAPGAFEEPGAGFASSGPDASSFTPPPGAYGGFQDWSAPPVVAPPVIATAEATPFGPPTVNPGETMLFPSPAAASNAPPAATQPIMEPPVTMPPDGDIFMQALATETPTMEGQPAWTLPPSSPAPPTLPEISQHPLPEQPVAPMAEPVPAWPPVSMSAPVAPPVTPVAPPATDFSYAGPTTPMPQYQINPPTIVEERPVHGTEMVARVGTEVILMCDIQPQLRRAALRIFEDQIKEMPEEQRKLIPLEEKDEFVNMIIQTHYPALLQEQIHVALVFNDFVMFQGREGRAMFEKKLGEEFDRSEVPAMMEEFGVENMYDLKEFLKRELGSSLDRERMLWVRSKIAQEWIRHSVETASGECTIPEMNEYYTTHLDEFTTKARAQWRELCVYFSKHATEKEAYDRIAWMGNQVAAGASFEEIAGAHSEGFTAANGGLWDWTSPGSLSSTELDGAVFSQPIGQLSPQIIKSDKGFHIIQVVQRQEETVKPFKDAQKDIRRKIEMQRMQANQDEYFAELKQKYPVRIHKEKIRFKENVARPAMPQNGRMFQ